MLHCSTRLTVIMLTLLVYTGTNTGLLFRKLPNLKLAVSMEDIKYTDPVRDVGLIELPVKW
jgi:hypothetical protein